MKGSHVEATNHVLRYIMRLFFPLESFPFNILKYLKLLSLAEHKPKFAHFRIEIGVNQDHLTNHVAVTRRQKKLVIVVRVPIHTY